MIGELAVTVTTTSALRSAYELLGWSRSVIDAPMRAAVDLMPSSMRLICGYHLGWWDHHGTACAGTAGKAIRPALALVSARIAGGAHVEAVPAAVAVELVHNFSLLHDDVMDNDRTRRHRPTAWTVFGVDQAILAGDAMLAAAYRVLAASGSPHTATAVRWLSECVERLCDGQSNDLSFTHRRDVTVDECVRMAQAKTGALLGTSCALGALLSGADARQIDAVRAFGEHLGLTFQLVDDMLGIWGDKAATGKPAGGDLACRKQSFPVVAALASRTRAGADLSALYAQPEPFSATQVTMAAQLVESAGGREWTRRRAAFEVTSALQSLDVTGIGTQTRADLLALAELITQRGR